MRYSMLGWAGMLAATFACTRAAPPAPTPASGGVILAADQGELYHLGQRRSPTLIKVDPKVAGSKHLFMLSEVLPPGTGVPVHRHTHDEEILFIHAGTVTVTLGDRQAEARAGATVFIPPNTWIGVQNTGSEPATFLAIFPEPSTGDYFRGIGRSPGDTRPPPTAAEFAELNRRHHMVYR